MWNFITLPDGHSLILLISTIAFYAYYRLLLRYWLKGYWGGLRLSHRDIIAMRRLSMPLEELLTELVKAQHNGDEAQQVLDVILKSARNGIALNIEEADRQRRTS